MEAVGTGDIDLHCIDNMGNPWGLDDLADAHFPRNYISADVQLGKLKHARKPLLTGHVPDRCMASISWDTAGPTQTRSINGYNYVTVFVCRYSMYYWAYGHHSTAQIPELFDKFYADVAPLREKHGPILSVRRDRASVNISAAFEHKLVRLGIRSETSNSYEPWQNGDAERAIGTLSGIARTVMLASGLVGRFWFSGFCYAAVVHNITYSSRLKSSPHLLMYGEKPDISNHQQFGCEAFLYRSDIQHKGKWDARAEKAVFVGYPSNQKGYLLWCPDRGSNVIVSTTNWYFGICLPYATRPAVELIPGSVNELPLPERPAALNFEDLRALLDPRVIGTYQGNFVASGSGLWSPRLLAPSDFMSALAFTHENDLSSAHFSLVESFNLMDIPLPFDVFSQEVLTTRPAPKNLAAALSPQFVGEYSPAIDKENAGFMKHECFEVIRLPEGAKCLPTQWIFTRNATVPLWRTL